jgi:hypothetical protein
MYGVSSSAGALARAGIASELKTTTTIHARMAATIAKSAGAGEARSRRADVDSRAERSYGRRMLRFCLCLALSACAPPLGAVGYSYNGFRGETSDTMSPTDCTMTVKRTPDGGWRGVSALFCRPAGGRRSVILEHKIFASPDGVSLEPLGAVHISLTPQDCATFKVDLQAKDGVASALLQLDCTRQDGTRVKGELRADRCDVMEGP